MTPAEIAAMIQVFNLLEPEAQKGISGLIHLLHKKPKTAQDYINQAQALLAAQPKVEP